MSCHIEHFTGKLIAKPVSWVVELDGIAEHHLCDDLIQSFHETHFTGDDFPSVRIRHFNFNWLVTDISAE